MDNKSLIAVGVIVIVVFLAFVFALPGGTDLPEAGTAIGTAGGMETRTSDMESVTIDLTPVTVNENEIIFNIGVNTHSVDLSAYDLKALAILSYSGKNVKPSGAPALSGHHNSGVLSFAVDEEPASFAVTIINLPAGERAFTWP